VSVHNFGRLFELGIYEMSIDLEDIKVIKVVNGFEQPHTRTSAAGFNERGNRLPVCRGRNKFLSQLRNQQLFNVSPCSDLSYWKHRVAWCFSQRDSAFVKFSVSRKTQNTDRSTCYH
jgi:hypothetical protein